MYANAGYLNNSMPPFEDSSKPLIVGSSGLCRLTNRKFLPTWRAEGRVDYQLLYVAAGKTHFIIDGVDHTVTAGHMVLYSPGEPQFYEYFGKEKPEVYWVHFTGGDVEGILREYAIPRNKNIFFSGVSLVYANLFMEMISELQNCQTGYRDMLTMYLRQLFQQVQRSREERRPVVSAGIQEEIGYALRYFSEHYNEPIEIKEYAHRRGMSVSWFLRCFKQVTGKTPVQYITALRISNAVSLMESSDCNVTEAAAIVGYDNPFYFSRLFREQFGFPPSEYRKNF